MKDPDAGHQWWIMMMKMIMMINLLAFFADGGVLKSD